MGEPSLKEAPGFTCGVEVATATEVCVHSLESYVFGVECDFAKDCGGSLDYEFSNSLPVDTNAPDYCDYADSTASVISIRTV